MVKGEVKLVLRGDRKSDFFSNAVAVTHTKTDSRSLPLKKILSKRAEEEGGLIENRKLTLSPSKKKEARTERTLDCFSSSFVLPSFKSDFQAR